MIKTKQNGNSIITYSDENYKIKQIETGKIYDIASDIMPSKFTYEETSEKIEKTIEEETIEE